MKKILTVLTFLSFSINQVNNITGYAVKYPVMLLIVLAQYTHSN